MKVVVLCRKLEGMPANGFDRYSHDLVENLSKLPEVEIILPNQTPSLDIRSYGSVASPLYYDIFLPIVTILRGRMKGDVFHAVTDGQAVVFPWLKGKKILTMHHVDKTTPIGVKEKIFRVFYGFGTRMGVEHADMIICISEQTKKEIQEAYGVEDSRLCVINHSVSSRFQQLPDVKKERVVGYLGALKNRKNLEFMIRTAAAYKKMYPDDKVIFSICGEGPENGRLKSLTAQLALDDTIEFRGKIPDDGLVNTYNSFKLFCLPSLQEGFGLPVIEAERCGVPVLTIADAMIPEEVVTAATKCQDEEDMAAKIHLLLDDETAYQEAVDKSLKHSQIFSPECTAKQTLEVYQKVLGRS